jgi:hypothetical protein
VEGSWARLARQARETSGALNSTDLHSDSACASNEQHGLRGCALARQAERLGVATDPFVDGWFWLPRSARFAGAPAALVPHRSCGL